MASPLHQNKNVIDDLCNDLHTLGYAKFYEDSVVDDINALINETQHVIQLLCEHHGVSFDENDVLSDGLIQLGKKDRRLVGHIYDAASRLQTMHQLSLSSFFVELSKAFMQSDLVQVALDKAIRIDMPSEEKYLFPLHQDYTYDPSSVDGLVFWIPLQDTTIENGTLSLYEKSHDGGIRNIEVMHQDNASVSGAKMFELEPIDLSDYKKVTIDVKKGEVLVFSNLLLHHSNENKSNRVRLTVQNRFGNFLHPKAIEKGLPHGNFRSKWFYETHPEFSKTKNS